MNIKVQISGLVILFIILYFYLYHRKVKLRTEKAFFRLLIAVIVSACLDIFSIYVIHNADIINGTFLNVVCKLYVMSVIACVQSSLLYVCVDIYKDVDVYRKVAVRSYALLALAAICVGVLPIEHYNDEVNQVAYTYGSSVIVGYSFGFVFLATLIAYITFSKKKMNVRRRNAMTVWIIVWCVASITQVFNNELLLITFAGALGIIIVYLLLENPEANIDRELGVFNQNALNKYVKDLYDRHKPFSMLEIVVDRGIGSIGAELCSYLLGLPQGAVFRYSSDNIMLIFPEDDTTAIRYKEIIAMRLEQGFGRDNNIIIKPYWFCLSDSSAVADGEEFFSLVQYAHLNVADKVSSDITFIDSDMAEDMQNFKEAEKLLEEAIKNDSVEVFYQPIFSTKEHKFVSAEALVRIRDHHGNIIYPGTFIDIAESNGIILKLVEMVFEKVFRFIKNNPLETLGLSYIEINLSVVQCAHRNLVADYMLIMNKYGIKPTNIALEITETASAGAKKILLENMRVMRDFGVRFALDDFGTGHSNLNYMAEMPVDILKFDKGMTQAYFHSQKAKYVMNAAIEMARGMKLAIVFEGVETREEYQEAERIGIDYIQGYYFSKPLSETDFLNFLL
ncbi:MAG: EAL domain-containing protein [Lachnospiraceae bacterium]|nr:EAL domain-containing protein [Lachnospiraceae bacterium]